MVPGEIEWAKLRAMVLHRDGRCLNCGLVMGLAPHHIKTRGSGGLDVEENLITLCLFCHRTVHDGSLVVAHRETVSVAKKKGWMILSGEKAKDHMRALVKESIGV
tara:strand:+ start:1948 stop:2262 length:315 start_codon:yes stop_codon:yes gene_type:complete